MRTNTQRQTLMNASLLWLSLSWVLIARLSFITIYNCWLYCVHLLQIKGCCCWCSFMREVDVYLLNTGNYSIVLLFVCLSLHYYVYRISGSAYTHTPLSFSVSQYGLVLLALSQYGLVLLGHPVEYQALLTHTHTHTLHLAFQSVNMDLFSMWSETDRYTV